MRSLYISRTGKEGGTADILNIMKAYLSACSVIITSLSDHDMVGCVRKLHNIKFKPRTITCRNYKQFYIASFKSEVSNLSFPDYSKFTNINEAWDNWKTKFLSAVDKHAPLINKRVRGRETPRITSKIKNSMRENGTVEHFQIIPSYLRSQEHVSLIKVLFVMADSEKK